MEIALTIVGVVLTVVGIIVGVILHKSNSPDAKRQADATEELARIAREKRLEELAAHEEKLEVHLANRNPREGTIDEARYREIAVHIKNCNNRHEHTIEKIVFRLSSGESIECIRSSPSLIIQNEHKLPLKIAPNGKADPTFLITQLMARFDSFGDKHWYIQRGRYFQVGVDVVGESGKPWKTDFVDFDVENILKL